ncbi:hypothetical protein K1726_23945, partial [Clostridium estertheticum]
DEYNRGTIVEFVEKYKEILLDIIRYCVEKEETEMTPSDFTGKEISIEELQDIKSIINISFDKG